MGIALELQIAETISALNSATSTESASLNVAWVRSTYWFAPYMLWIGLVLMVSGGVLGIVGPLFSGKAGYNVESEVDDERYLHP
jgi:hypothetical protein